VTGGGQEGLDTVYHYFPGFERNVVKLPASSAREQQMTVVGRALMANPS